LDGCLVAYPLREWAAFEEKLMGLPQFDKAVRQLRRIYFSSAVECDVDNVGRLLIPQTLRNHAELRRDVLWTGMGPHLELWDKDRYATMREKILSDEPTREEMERRLADLGL
jgi:MraZ protein